MDDTNNQFDAIVPEPGPETFPFVPADAPAKHEEPAEHDAEAPEPPEVPERDDQDVEFEREEPAEHDEALAFASLHEEEHHEAPPVLDDPRTCVVCHNEFSGTSPMRCESRPDWCAHCCPHPACHERADSL